MGKLYMMQLLQPSQKCVDRYNDTTATARRLDRITQALALMGFAGLVAVAF